MPRAHLHNISAMWLLPYIVFPQVEDYTAYSKIHLFHYYQREFYCHKNLHAFLSFEFTKKQLERKKCPYYILTADVINHKSQGRWNCCTGLEVSAILWKPLHLLFCDTAKQTKNAWYSSSIFMFMFIHQCFLFFLLFGLKNRFD